MARTPMPMIGGMPMGMPRPMGRTPEQQRQWEEEGALRESQSWSAGYPANPQSQGSLMPFEGARAGINARRSGDNRPRDPGWQQPAQSQDMAITNRRPPNPNLQGINALQGFPMQQNLRYPMQNQGNVQNQGNRDVQALTSQGNSLASGAPARGGIDFGANMTDFQDLTPGEQTQGQILGIGKTLQDYLFGATKEVDVIDPETGEVTGTETVSDYEAFVPSDSYVPTLDDAPGFTQALEAAQGGLGQYQDYFSGGADAMNSATAQAQMAQDQANARGDAATGQARMGQDRANMRSNAATQAAAQTRGLANTYSLARGNMAQDFANRAVNKTGVTQDLANRIAHQTRGEVGDARNLGNRLAGATQGLGNTYAHQARRQGNLQSDIARQAIGGDLNREEALTAQSIGNAQYTQQLMRDLSGPGAGAAYMDPYQNAVIQDTLRRLNEQGMQAQNQASAKAIQSGAFGGSREGVMQAQLGQRLQDTKADYLNKAMSQNFLQAQNAAQGAATLAGQGGQLAQGAYTTGSGRAIQGGQLALGAGELGARTALQGGELAARTALQGGELAARTALQGGELGLQAGQLGTDTALRGGQLGIQAGQLGADTALKGGELLSRTALQGGQLLAETQADAARTALAGGELGARTQADAARIALAGGELGSNTALKLGQGLGALGSSASETDQRELMNLAKLGLAPMDVFQAGATATQGNELAEAYGGMRDFGILGDYYRGVPSTQSVGMSQGSAGVANPWAAGIGGGLAGLQAGKVLGG